jgi:cytidylate kinase
VALESDSISGELLALAGPMGAGKTTLAKELSRILRWPIGSTSSYIARITSSEGLEPTRSRIQSVGMNLIAADPKSFVRGFLENYAWSPGNGLIIDSARQPVFFSELVDAAAPSGVRLIFVEAPFHVRASRVDAREGMSCEELRSFDAHPVEMDVPELRHVAGLELSGLDEQQELVRKVMDWLRDSHFDIVNATPIDRRE